MTDDFVECFNCGSANPEWAQACRSCGVPLRQGEALATPAGRIPTDRNSLLSLAAVLATILVAVLLGLFASSLNPIDPTIGQETEATATATATPTAEPSEEPSLAPTGTGAAPDPSAAPELPGTVTFGTALGDNDQVVEPADTFTPGMTFAHSISVPEPFGVEVIGEEVVRIADDGTEEVVASHVGDDPSVLTVDPAATTAGFAVDASNLLAAWGPGLYEMRVYTGETMVARGQFRLSEG